MEETILQFGSGKFLRGFVDYFVHEANQAGQAVGRIVVAQSTGGRRAELLNQQDGRYHVVIRGLHQGRTIDQVEEVQSISRALVISQQWDELLQVAHAPALRYLVCNTAETGYALDAADSAAMALPRSFPARLLRVLQARFQAGQPGLTILPCELFENNADLLRGLILKLAAEWGLGGELRRWIEHECAWHNTLVDRIVTVPDGPLFPGAASDGLVTVAEPFALWAIEVRDCHRIKFDHPAMQFVPNVMPYFLRKVRILNAAHTAMATRAAARGIRTVREAMANAELAGWIEAMLFEEIVPTLMGRVEDPERFARQTLERFRNPFLEHKIADILVHHADKVRLRLLPTRAEHVERFGRPPQRLDEALAEAATPVTA